MFKSLGVRILASMISVIFITTLVIVIFVQRKIENEILKVQNENALNLVNTFTLNVENAYKSIIFHEETTFKNRKLQLKNIVNVAMSIISGYYLDYRKGIISEKEARKKSISEIRSFRYDEGVGYLWINNTDRPFPRMIMHPTLPELNGKILNDKKFNSALGIKKNLFVALVDVCLKKGDGYVDYLWPKPTRKGLTEYQPKISYVKIFREWNWVVGSGVYIDDIEKEKQNRLNAVIKDLKETSSKVTITESGYMFIFNGEKRLLVHPNLEGTDGNKLINPVTGKKIFDELKEASKNPEKPFDYVWNKPGDEDKYIYPKRAYIRYFKPLDWYIVASIYLDEIEKPGHILSRNIILLSIVFVFIALVISLFLARNLTKPLINLMNAAEKIEKDGIADAEIPVSGTMETRELGTILAKMITSIERTEEQLRQSQKMETVGTLAGGLAHDFNNVLGGITGTLSIMDFKLKKDGHIEKDKMEDYLDNMIGCGNRAAAMVQQLLTLSRKQEMHFSPVDINTIIKHVIKICQSTFDKSIKIETEYPDSPPIVNADANQLEQVLLNFCVNAAHAMTIMREGSETWGGILTISVRNIPKDRYFSKYHAEAEEKDYYCITVKDTGVGMDSNVLSKIYNPFFTTKKKGEGTGLGLSMVYGIIKQHKGFIDAYSEVGTGTTFNIYLPSLEVADIEKTEIKNISEPPRGEGLILIVDDEEIMRTIASEILMSSGYSVIHAENGKICVDIFKEHHHEIKAVLLDMVMPEMSGKEAFIHLHDIDPDVKVILSSGFKHDERVTDLLNMGVKSFIQKPYTFKELAEEMHRVTHHR